MENILGPIGNITQQKGCRLIEMSGPQADKLLVYKGLKVDGKNVTLEKVGKRLSPSQIFDFLQEELRTQEESEVIKGNVENSSAVVQTSESRR